MIAPLTPFPIRGVIWFQGESNTDELTAPRYAALLQALIREWRSRWAEGDFPFLIVQIANFGRDPDSLWPEVRDAQRRALSMRNTAMAVTIDIGDPDQIHPTNKQDVGKRLALAARAVAYGEPIEYSGPLYRQTVAEGTSLRILFDHAAGGLVSKGGDPDGFEIADTDRKFVPAKAKIDGSSVVVSSQSVPAPVYVRYGWSASPHCNL
jgi:sialate O-acetylesterase